MLVLGVFLVAVGGVRRKMLSRISDNLLSSLDLAAAISQIPLVHYVQEGGKLTADLVVAVHPIGNSNEADVSLSEIDLGVITDFKVITTDTAHILRDNHTDLTRFDVLNQTFPIGSVEAAAAVTVIGVLGDVSVAVLFSIGFEHFLLIHDGIAIAKLLVVSGQSFIKGSNLSVNLLVVHH